MSKIRYILEKVTVEPLLFAFYFGFVIFQSASFPALYNKVCENIVQFDNFSYCADRENNPDENIEEHIQAATDKWILYNALANFVPSFVSTMAIGSYGDEHGRKIPALLGAASLVAYIGLYNMLTSISLFPIWTLTIFSFFLGFLNFQTLYVMTTFSHIADIIQDEEELTLRYTILTAFWSTAYVIGGYVGGILLQIYNTETVMLIGQCIACFSFFFTLLYMKSTPKPPLKSVKGESIEKSVGMCQEMIKVTQSCYETIVRKRPLDGRLHLALACGVMVIYASEDSGTDQVFSLYAYSRGFSPSLLSWYFSTMSLIQMVCSLIGSYVMKRLKWEDSTIVIVGMLSTAAKMLTNGLAPNTTVMWLALGFGGLSTVGYPAMRAFVVRLGVKQESGESESGELLSLLSVVTNLFPLFSAVVYVNVYQATIHGYNGTAFIVAAGLLVICAMIMGGINWHRNRLKQDDYSECS